MSNQFEQGQLVQTPKGKGQIDDISRGWFTVQLESGESAKFRAKDLTPADVGIYRMSDHIGKYRDRYQQAVSPTNGRSMNNGDPLAIYLEGKTWQEVCRIADEALGEEAGFHATKYERLNVGQRRMNAGNRLRAAIKRGDWLVPA